MRIDFSKMSNSALSLLISKAADELNERLSTTHKVNRIESAKSPILKINEPREEDKYFALKIKSLLESGRYIKAEERKRVAAIASEYPDWARKQFLPADKGTGPWNKAREFARIKLSKERR